MRRKEGKQKEKNHEIVLLAKTKLNNIEVKKGSI